MMWVHAFVSSSLMVTSSSSQRWRLEPVELIVGEAYQCCMAAHASICCTQVALVEFCIQADDLKQAVAAGRRFGLLEDTFPTLERAYKSRTIGKLAAKRQWSVAAAVAGEDPQLQVQKT